MSSPEELAHRWDRDGREEKELDQHVLDIEEENRTRYAYETDGCTVKGTWIPGPYCTPDCADEPCAHGMPCGAEGKPEVLDGT